MSGGIAPHIITFGARWRQVVSITSWPLYTRRKSPSSQFGMTTGGPQRRCERCENNLLSPPGIQPRFFDLSARSRLLYQLSYPGSFPNPGIVSLMRPWQLLPQVILLHRIQPYFTTENDGCAVEIARYVTYVLSMPRFFR
jgi:hypothetical protein